MALYPFYVDEKVTTWKRTHFDIEADSYEEAKEKAKSFVEADNHELIPWEDVDGIIVEKMTTKENDGQSTMELYSSPTELIYQNGQ